MQCTEMDNNNAILCSSGMNLADSDANLEPPTSQQRTHTEEAGQQFSQHCSFVCIVLK